jgi:hypothetical protein
MLRFQQFITVNKTPLIAQSPYNPDLSPPYLFPFLKYKFNLKGCNSESGGNKGGKNTRENSVCTCLHNITLYLHTLHIHSPMEIEPTQCSKTLALKLHMSGNNPQDYTQH